MSSENEMSTQLQDQLTRLQQLRSQLQMVIQQRQQVEIRLREVEQAIDALEKIDEATSVFRSIGSLLIKTKGKEEVLNELKEDKETLGLRKATLDKQEGKLKEKLAEMESKVENALKLSQKT
ncbi:MAG: prefoldin subunit beta [Candidatus Odinarchaeota archaeon]|nr:prefoldin subunit beta [Candidatus Odinarchaeota archaeon]RLF46020.1 MAG: prefoldin subunit beta [Thermoplasmata archaeon]